MPFNRASVLPYEVELRATLDAALYHWQELGTAATNCLAIEEKWARGPEVDPLDWSTKVRGQSRIFDCLDGFLSAWARISLLFFPTGRRALTRERGATLRHLFGIDESSPIFDRDLRNAWMHHDERIDILVSEGRRAAGQLFIRSDDVTDRTREDYLRIIEIDTLVVHCQDQGGMPQQADLRALRGALEDLQRAQDTAFDKLQMPDDEEVT